MRGPRITAKGQPLTVSAAPMPKPGAGEILVRNRAIALNPFDGVVKTLGSVVTAWVIYPAILGSDVAGEVVAVGTSVSRFEPGDQVLTTRHRQARQSCGRGCLPELRDLARGRCDVHSGLDEL